MKILFLTPYPVEGPSSRYRVEQYIPYFRKNGIECRVRSFVSSRFYKILYREGFIFKKTIYFIESSVKRFLDIFTALQSDIIFIHLEAFPLGPPLFEWLLAKLGKRIIYDLDDAVYMGRTSPSNKFIKYLKWPSKVKKIIKMSRFVITCNEYLANYARGFNKNVTVIHTAVDTEKFTPRIKGDASPVTIGWVGSHTTAPYLLRLKDVFRRLSVRYKFNLKIVGALNHKLDVPGVKMINMDWYLEDEARYFQSLDIGVYPLPNDEWVCGKTGFKAIQYMSVGIPCVAAKIGANRDIINDGINGCIADTEDEWLEKLSMLIERPLLRQEIGQNARKTVVERYSVRVNAPRYLEIIKRVYAGDHGYR